MVDELDPLVEEKKILESYIDNLTPVRELLKSRGWGVVEHHFKTLLKIFQDQVMVEPDQTKIIRLQERYRAHLEMIEAVRLMAEKAEASQQELQSLQAMEKYNSDFGLTDA